MLQGRAYVSAEDVRAVAAPVLRHRLILNFNAQAEEVSADSIVERLAHILPSDPAKGTLRGRVSQVFKSADAG